MNAIPKVSPASAWGIFICFVGIIWTYISWFSACSGINRMLGEDKVPGFSILIPIWGNLVTAELADHLNAVIQKEGLQIQPVEKPNIVLCILFLFVPLMQIWGDYNRVADAYNAKYGVAAV